MKKQIVFISYTFEDLKEEREKVIETIQNKNCIPVGMVMRCIMYFCVAF